MNKRYGFTLIELLIVIAIIAIIAAIAIPNLMQSRIRANEANAIAALKGYLDAQIKFQSDKQGRDPANSASGPDGYCDNFRNLYYGQKAGQKSLLELIPKAQADAFANGSQDGAPTATRGIAETGGSGTGAPHQGYVFMTPIVPDRAGFFATDCALLAIPASDSTPGANVYWIGREGTVWQYSIGGGKTVQAIVEDIGERNPSKPGFAESADDHKGWMKIS